MPSPPEIPFNKPFFAGKELDYIAEAVAQGQLSGDGPFTRRCHAWLESHLGCRRAFLTPSCTAALEMTAILCDLKPGDEVILPSFTFASTANAFVLRGAVPVFVDIHADVPNIDAALVEAAVTPRTRAIVPVHYAGQACDMDALMSIAAARNLYVVEDAAQSLLSTYKGKQLGSIGHFGCLSFHETKNVISGEGGALLVNDARFIERAEIIREKGTNRSRFFRGEVDKYTWMDIGSSYLPSELVGAFLFAQLERAAEIVAERRRLCAHYTACLRDLAARGTITLPGAPDASDSNGHLFYLLAPSPAQRDALLKHLRARGIWAIFHFIPLHDSPAGRTYGRVGSVMTNTVATSNRLIRLPLYFGMQQFDVERVAEEIHAFFTT